jgi:hypothetical protein
MYNGTNSAHEHRSEDQNTKVMLMHLLFYILLC